MPGVTAIRRVLATPRKHYGLIASSYPTSFLSHRLNGLASGSVADCLGVVCGGRGALSLVGSHPCLRPTWRSSRVSSPCASSKACSCPANSLHRRDCKVHASRCGTNAKADRSDSLPFGKQHFLSAWPSCNSSCITSKTHEMSVSTPFQTSGKASTYASHNDALA